MVGTTAPEQRLEKRVGENARVKDLLETMQRHLAASVFEEGGHGATLTPTVVVVVTIEPPFVPYLSSTSGRPGQPYWE